MLGIMSIFGVFVIRVDSKYLLLDVFPDIAEIPPARELRRAHPDDWHRYGRVIGDRKELIEQSELISLFKRCLRVVSVEFWREWIIKELIKVDNSWYNRPRNNILYNFSTWTEVDPIDRVVAIESQGVLLEAARNLFDRDHQNKIGSIAQSLLIVLLLRRVWEELRNSVVLNVGEGPASLEPTVGTNQLVLRFETIINELAEAAVRP
jgi:hypothetical protein